MTTTAPRPTEHEIAAFVDQVRAHLTGLTDEERDDLTGGLEADLADQLAEPYGSAGWAGGVDLDDPRAYAAELRLAAGLPEATTRRLALPQLPQVVGVEATLDACRAGFLQVVGSRPWSAATWDVVRELGPIWWAARAWIALTVLDAARADHPVSLVPSFGSPVAAFASLAAALVLSVLLGLGRLLPDPRARGHLAGRLAVLALNVAVVVGVCTLEVPMPGYMVGSNTCI
ncbi:hypothetical protein [Nocardioides plantarum]|uniref:Uncharacterized protein n=1 Tax=Nocardioides plantarum TaxID=29299 RepID=A0ABV5K8I0_9ACTN|nr:hypothetical protein [Nocardioides plantarum]